MRGIRVAALVLAGVLVGSVLIVPAAAHLDGLRHLIKHLKKSFYTEAEAEALFVAAGEIRLSQNGPWYGNGGTFVSYQADQVVIERGDSGATQLDAHLPLLAPSQVGGEAYALKEVEVCYSLVDANDKVDYTLVYDNRTESDLIVDDQTDRTSTEYECYATGPSSPVVPKGSLTLVVRNTTDNAGLDNILFRSVRTSWVPV
jgi:hypothetical protein